MNEHQTPNLVIIGNTAYDTKEYVINKKKRVRDIGGACLYSAIPASLFSRVGIVTRVGKDFEISKIRNYNIDFSGVKMVDDDTTHFYTKFFSKDGQEATTYGEVDEKMIIDFKDIPENFLHAPYIHFTTNNPNYLLPIMKKLKENSDAIISVDTIKGYAEMEETKEVFDIADIAFIDIEFKDLLKCKAPKKIIKLGKEGCLFISNKKKLQQKATVKEKVVDKLGAGDCLNGVFMNLIANGSSEEYALKKAVETATLSIDDFGILNLKNKMFGNEERGRKIDV